LRLGHGHPAGLNFGDCFAYALAKKSTRKPLRTKGDGFSHTDVAIAWATRRPTRQFSQTMWAR